MNGTTVTITPSETTGLRIAGVPYNITLNEGELMNSETVTMRLLILQEQKSLLISQRA
ncbi:MAG: hypothetical protein IPI04_07770 [Ignavibacteria bacterium]|nr:hypothetical protein [Ignavibacteria bacterium]